MQKKIIALAVASALVAPAAFADTSNVTVYGVANVSYDLVTTKKCSR
jgi:predicted porin